jgi:predicted aldo/keto reductase-like oxidoreductase
MEPLRGGKLVNIPKQAKDALQQSELGYTPAELGLRWLWNQPEVTCVLSGMNSMEMVEENISIASDAEAGDFGDAEFALVDQIKGIIRAKEKVGCTGCRYCTEGCPMGLNIPMLIEIYNDLRYMPSVNTSLKIEFMEEDKRPTACIGCGACVAICPQNIDIPAAMKELSETMRKVPSWREVCRQREEEQKRLNQ